MHGPITFTIDIIIEVKIHSESLISFEKLNNRNIWENGTVYSTFRQHVKNGPL